jgi:hypothetical protein
MDEGEARKEKVSAPRLSECRPRMAFTVWVAICAPFMIMQNHYGLLE